jgi:pseudaminic acid biosynthesis-associated methylase
MVYETEQEKFWAGEFGDDYTGRNSQDLLLRSKLMRLQRILRRTNNIKSIVELGCNRGLNLQALELLDRSLELEGYEINVSAAQKAKDLHLGKITCGTITQEIKTNKEFDLSFTSGVLIHIHPAKLEEVYKNLVKLSRRYILVIEYYNPTPMEVVYRGERERLFKRDFAGELMERYNLALVDYGFSYHRERFLMNDDSSWFLLEKSF